MPDTHDNAPASDSQTPADVTGDFTSDGVDDFGSAGAFEGTLPGEQPPSTGPTGAANDIDNLLSGVDLTDATEALNDGKKVKFSGNVVGVKSWSPADNPARVCLIFDIVPVSPPACAGAGKQGYWCEIKGDKEAEGKANLRALAKACNKSPDKPSTFVGSVVEGDMNKAKKTGKIYVAFAA